MSRIRTIKPEFFTSSDIIELTPLSRLFYVSLWCESDRDGRMNWNTKTLKFRYFPADDCDIDAMAVELIDAGLIVIYEVDGKTYAEIPSFTTHQVINNRESDSIIPPRVKDASKRRESGDQGEGKEGREGKGREHQTSAKKITFADGFDIFWLAYPKRVAKADAEKAWGKIKPDAVLRDKILNAVSAAARSPDWLKESGQFIPNAATWLNGKRWEDAKVVNITSGGGVDPRWKGAK